MLEDIERYTDYETELLDTLTRQHEELAQLKALRDAEHAPAGAESARTEPDGDTTRTRWKGHKGDAL